MCSKFFLTFLEFYLCIWANLFFILPAILSTENNAIIFFNLPCISFKARRSQVYAKHLREVADKFRSDFLDSDDKKDKTPYNEDDWRKQVPKGGSALGGPYLGLHMRRADFAYAHHKTVPSIKEIGEEVKKQLKKYKLKKVYVSTDGSQEGRSLAFLDKNRMNERVPISIHVFVN